MALSTSSNSSVILPILFVKLAKTPAIAVATLFVITNANFTVEKNGVESEDEEDLLFARQQIIKVAGMLEKFSSGPGFRLSPVFFQKASRD